MNTVLKSALRLAVIVATAAFGLANTANAAVVTYGWGERALFESQLGAKYTEDFENPLYAHGDKHDASNFDVFTNSRMNEISPEIGYRSTGHDNNNIVGANYGRPGHSYCAGCNGSFELDLTNTSYSVGGGVAGLGLDITPMNNYQVYASILFVDNSWLDIALDTAESFWGIVSDIAIAKIHFGLPNHGPTINVTFSVDDITIGSRANAHNVPAPTPLLLIALGLIGLGVARRRHA